MFLDEYLPHEISVGMLKQAVFLHGNFHRRGLMESVFRRKIQDLTYTEYVKNRTILGDLKKYEELQRKVADIFKDLYGSDITLNMDDDGNCLECDEAVEVLNSEIIRLLGYKPGWMAP